MLIDCDAIERVAGTVYECESGGRCINSSRLCDGSNDCLDWSDETNCEYFITLLLKHSEL